MSQSSSVPTTGKGESGAKSTATSTDAASTALKEGIVAGARDLSTEVKHVAEDVALEAKKAAESKIDAGKDFAAEHLGAVAGALRETSRQLRQSESGLTEYVDKAARSVDGVSTYLQTRTLSQLMSDLEGYARREPAVFLGGAFFAGMLGGRFLKSATPAKVQRAAQSNPRGEQQGGYGARPQLGHGTSPASPAGTGGQGDEASAQPNSRVDDDLRDTPVPGSSSKKDSTVPESATKSKSSSKPGESSGAR